MMCLEMKSNESEEVEKKSHQLQSENEKSRK